MLLGGQNVDTLRSLCSSSSSHGGAGYGALLSRSAEQYTMREALQFCFWTVQHLWEQRDVRYCCNAALRCSIKCGRSLPLWAAYFRGLGGTKKPR